MQVLYERCAAVDVGKDVIAVAVRLPGDGPDGRQTIKRTFKTFYGVLAEAARWLTGLGVTHVAMEATGIYSMPVYHALVAPGRLGCSDSGPLTCAPTATRTRDLLLRRHFRSVAGWCHAWPDMPLGDTHSGCMWPDVASHLWSLALR